MAETKLKTNSSLRTPKPKKLGLSVPPALRLPHEDLILSDSQSGEIAEAASLPSHPSHTTHTTEASLSSTASHSSQPSQSWRGEAVEESYATPADPHVEEPRLRLSPTQAEAPPAASHASASSLTGLPSMPSAPSQTSHTSEQRYSESGWEETADQNTTRPAMPTQTGPASHSTLTSQTRQIEQPIAPMRDFMKVANSIGRQAVPAGIFTGKSKQLYDCLYSLTRGAIVPSRTVRISRPRLMKRAHIGSRVTFDANVSRLLNVGLISVKQIPGEHEGNEYTVYLPEESSTGTLTPTGQSSQSSESGLSGHTQYQDSPDRLESSHTSNSINNDIQTSYGSPKTFFNTNQNTDDDVFEELTKALRIAVLRIKGSAVTFTPAERAKWGEVGDVIVDELLQAARRAQIVTSVPAFLAAHLRRRFAARSNELYEERPSRSYVRPIDEPSLESSAIREITQMTTEQIRESAEMLSELLSRGEYTVAAVTEQFSAGYRPEDWDAALKEAIDLAAKH